MMRITATLLALLATCAGAVSGQVVDDECTYDACAIRVERGAILRGLEGEKVGGGGDVDLLLAGPDSAAALAELYLGARDRGEIYSLLGGLGGLGLYVWADGSSEAADASDTLLGAFAVGLPLIHFSLSRGARHKELASESLSRAVWWFNRQFTAAPGGAAGAMPRPTLDGAGWDWAILVGGYGGAITGYAAGDDIEDAAIGSIIGTFGGFVVALIGDRLTESR